MKKAQHPRHNISRRQFISGMGSLGLVTAATSTLWLSPSLRNQVLDRASRWNDRAQGWLYSAERMAPTFAKTDISPHFPYNGFYPEAYVPQLSPQEWQLQISGLVENPNPLSLADLRGMQQEAQITQLICIEGWSAIGQWSGVPLHVLLKHIGAKQQHTHLHIRCADGYYTSIDMASALHPQTIIALDFLGQPLSPAFGAPARLRIPVKLGFKNAKFITELSIRENSSPNPSDSNGQGYWEEQGYNWFSGV